MYNALTHTRQDIILPHFLTSFSYFVNFCLLLFCPCFLHSCLVLETSVYLQYILYIVPSRQCGQFMFPADTVNCAG